MRREFEFTFANQAMGTCVIVTTKRLFRKPVVESYMCVRATPIMGGQWVNKATGLQPDDDLNSEINRAAQSQCLRSRRKYE